MHFPSVLPPANFARELAVRPLTIRHSLSLNDLPGACSETKALEKLAGAVGAATLERAAGTLGQALSPTALGGAVTLHQGLGELDRAVAATLQAMLAGSVPQDAPAARR
jgi:hypothetical protein